MLRHGFVVVVVSAAFFLACGGKIADSGGPNGGGSGTGSASKPTDGSCPPAGTVYCSADPPVAADDVTSCNQTLSDPNCGPDYKAFLACAEQHITCDASNQTDSQAIEDACENELQAFEGCLNQSPVTPPPDPDF